MYEEGEKGSNVSFTRTSNSTACFSGGDFQSVLLVLGLTLCTSKNVSTLIEKMPLIPPIVPKDAVVDEIVPYIITGTINQIECMVCSGRNATPFSYIHGLIGVLSDSAKVPEDYDRKAGDTCKISTFRPRGGSVGNLYCYTTKTCQRLLPWQGN